jgi:hypothetical protein
VREKGDHIDVLTLANILRTGRHLHRPLPANSELARTAGLLVLGEIDDEKLPVTTLALYRTAGVVPYVAAPRRNSRRTTVG